MVMLPGMLLAFVALVKLPLSRWRGPDEYGPVK
jgi:hypothetical protein